MTDNLLPCPFCGGEAEFNDTSSTWVRCEDCGAETQCQIEKKDAAQLWNRRTPAPQDQTPVEVENGVRWPGDPRPSPETNSRGAHDVLAERRRQMEIEDFGFEQDDHYTSGEMAWAAVCYLQNAAVSGKMQGLGLLTAEQCDERGRSLPQPEAWPWDAEWWKPAGQRRDLVKSAALIIAEIERLDRAASTEGSK